MGGLSNEDELAELCPPEFHQRDNSWRAYASKLFFVGAHIGNWQWKSTDKKERTRQLQIFHALMSGFGLDHNDKEAVAGWMLSEMLSEVPVHQELAS